ncbi:MAG: radical SAM protein [Deltaproteobacteria bacterium]|nr:MAG: radical SAM protein [Deltaproteobacteria bacterium]
MSAERPRVGTLAVEVTTHCPRRCVYCYNAWKADDGYDRRELPLDTLADLVDTALTEAGLRAVQVTGGEPLARRGIWDFLADLRRRGRRVALVTDGVLVDDDAATRLAALGVGPVQPTLLAADRALHDRLKGAPGSFDQTVAAIGRLRRARVPISVAFILMRDNADHFREVVELCFALGANTVALSRFCAAGAGTADPDALTPTAAQVRAALAVADEANAQLGMHVEVAVSLPLCVADPADYPHLRFGRCAMTSDRPGYTIDPAGRVRACSTSATLLGDLRHEPFAAIVARARREALAEAAQPPAACVGCPDWDACGGGCRVSALGTYGDLTRPDPLAVLR